MTTVSVQSGDVTSVSADVLVTAINSGGLWFGGVDGAIMRSAGTFFHGVAREAMPLSDGQLVYARPQVGSLGTAYGSVLFVVDDLRQPLGGLVLSALKDADTRGLRSVSLPLMRTGVMAGQFESPKEAVSQLAAAISEFIAGQPASVQSINVVAYGQDDDRKWLAFALREFAG